MKATVEVTYLTRHEDGLSEDLPEGVVERWVVGWHDDGYCMEFEFDTISGAKAFIEDIETDFGCPPCFTQEIERIKQ